MTVRKIDNLHGCHVFACKPILNDFLLSRYIEGSGSHNASNRSLASGEFEDYEDSVCKDAGTIRSTYKVENRTGLDGGWCGDKKLRRMVFYITLSTCVAMVRNPAIIYSHLVPSVQRNLYSVNNHSYISVHRYNYIAWLQ